jgi:hypothetical protein
MKKFFKVVLWIFVGGMILGFGGCAVTTIFVGKAVKDVAVETHNENKARKEACAEMLKNAKITKAKDSLNSTNVTYEFKNNSKFDFEYLELSLNAYDKKGTKLDTNFSNITNIKKGQTFKITVNMYQEGYDHYDVNEFGEDAFQ